MFVNVALYFMLHLNFMCIENKDNLGSEGFLAEKLLSILDLKMYMTLKYGLYLS